MTTETTVRGRLVDLRREFHRYPEPAWCEFYTTCTIAEEVERIGVDELHLGRAAMNPAERLAVPARDEIDAWRELALEEGARDDLLDCLGDCTGAVAVLDRGDGPTVGLRVDIDGLPQEEATDESHRPAVENFRSRREGLMHACGHDAHATIGLDVLEAVAESDFSGVFRAFFQPAEEVAGGGRPMARSEHANDVDYFFATHVGLGHPTGDVVAGIVEPLAVCNFDVEFRGRSAHAGLEPNAGHNAMAALGTALQNVYAIPRHADGTTRVNVGRVEGGTASNVVAERVTAAAEVRGETTSLMEYARRELERVVDGAARTHGCEADVTVTGQAPRADSDPELAALVHRAARDHPKVGNAIETASFGASEDATHLMRAVQNQGGAATYVIVGTDHPDGHHTPRFDVDESSLPIAVDVLTGAVLDAAARDPLDRETTDRGSTGAA